MCIENPIRSKQVLKYKLTDSFTKFNTQLYFFLILNKYLSIFAQSNTLLHIDTPSSVLKLTGRYQIQQYCMYNIHTSTVLSCVSLKPWGKLLNVYLWRVWLISDQDLYSGVLTGFKQNMEYYYYLA